MSNGRTATGNSRNQGSNNNSNNSRQQQQRQGISQPPQHQRLYDPNQPQHSPNSQSQPQSQKLSESTYPENSSATKSSAVLTTAAAVAPTSRGASAVSTPSDGLVRLTKEIQQLERKLMEKPGRRTLDSDDDSEGGHHRKDESLGWSRRIDNSKRLAYKYLKLMQLDFKSSVKHEIDTRCWKLAIYPLIETFRAALRNAEHTSNLSSAGLCLSDSDEDHSENIRHYFAEFIGVAQEFYAALKTTLQLLEAKHATPNGGLARTVHVPRWYRCVGILGDLARYRWLHKLNSDDPSLPPTDWLVVARRYYREAIDLGPGNGKMYNQLALLSGCRGLESLYYYSKSLTVRSSFVNARETLMSFFSSNEQIQTLMHSKQTSKARQAALATTTRRDCEGSFLLLHAMLFEKINLDNFDKRHRTFTKQLRVLHQPLFPDTSTDQSLAVTERWDVFYFMLAVVNIAAVYEFNWSASVLAKANTAFGQLRDHLATVATLPYSSKMLLSTMEQSMQRYLTSVGDTQRKVAVSSLEEQQGWLVYCHTILVWMAGRPLGSGGDMLNNWLALANHETLPGFWTTLVQFMNYHWNELSPFEQSDMLSALSEEISDQGSKDQHRGVTDNISFQLSLPPLGQEWELRGLAWLPTSRYSSAMFKGSQPVLDDADLNGGSFWKQEPPKSERLSKRLVELSLIAAMHMEVIEFDFCENAFKLNAEYAAQAEEAGLQAGSAEDDMTDDNFLSSSHASLSQDSGLEDEPTLNLTFSDMGIFDGHSPNADILELKSKRDQLKSLLSDNRRAVGPGSPKTYGSRGGLQDGGGPGRRNKGGRGYVDRKISNVGAASSRALQVAENSILVIDTNCLVSDWTAIQRVVSADRWTVIIPLAVITELDGLKNNPAPLGPAAAAALDYLEGCLAMRPKPRRLKIQTSRGNYMNDLSFRVESFNYEKQAPQQQQQPQQQHQRSNYQRHKRAVSGGAVGSGGSHDERDQDDEGGSEGDYYYYDDRDEEIMRNHNVDDFILGLCLWHQENGPSSSSSSLSPLTSASSSAGGIYLVTYDRNLRVKARARSVQVLGKDDLNTLTSSL
ncbi:hypothetical protein BGZ95_010818 [Linnemannia exigua]|uniref:PIN domain-containing protein n=1 Tax=Linnemannia exigua TaxID=604196 RepID=A0AAD4H6V9_9FUNG|nr:hypothetical protein BGZ95_010818 [Linnemannia exigua]